MSWINNKPPIWGDTVAPAWRACQKWLVWTPRFKMTEEVTRLIESKAAQREAMSEQMRNIRREHENQLENANRIHSSDAVAGRWYDTSIYGKVMCCGRYDSDTLSTPFAVRVHGVMKIRYLHDSLVKESPKQSW